MAEESVFGAAKSGEMGQLAILAVIRDTALLELEVLLEAMVEYAHRWERVSRTGPPQPLMKSVKRRIPRAVVGR